MRDHLIVIVIIDKLNLNSITFKLKRRWLVIVPPILAQGRKMWGN